MIESGFIKSVTVIWCKGGELKDVDIVIKGVIAVLLLFYVIFLNIVIL